MGLIVETPSAGGGGGPTIIRLPAKVTVVSSVSETDLLNALGVVTGGTLKTNGRIALRGAGHFKNNVLAAAVIPQFKVKFGAVTAIDTGVVAAKVATGATLNPFLVEIDVWGANATNAQFVSLRLIIYPGFANTDTQGQTAFTTGIGGTFTLVSTAWQLNHYIGTSNGNITVDSTVNQTLAFTVINQVNNAAYETELTTATISIDAGV